jgi:hypothetical protein
MPLVPLIPATPVLLPGGADRSGDVRAVKRAVPRAAAGEIAGRVLRRRDPVAGIGGNRVTTVAVVGHLRIENEVVAADEAAREIGMLRQAARIDDRDADAGGARRQVPGRRQVRAADFGAGTEVMPLAGIQRIVGHQHRLLQQIRLCVLDRRVGRKGPGQRAGLVHRQRLEEPNDEGATRHRALVHDRLACERGQALDMRRRRRFVSRRGRGTRGIAELHDHAMDRRMRGRRFLIASGVRSDSARRRHEVRVQDLRQQPGAVDRLARSIQRERLRQPELQRAVGCVADVREWRPDRRFQRCPLACGQSRGCVECDVVAQLHDEGVDRRAGDGRGVEGCGRGECDRRGKQHAQRKAPKNPATAKQCWHQEVPILSPIVRRASGSRAPGSGIERSSSRASRLPSA